MELQNAATNLIVVPVLDPSVDLTLRTIPQMMQKFVIDDHQFKHYSNGAKKYGRFGDMDHTGVHRLIVYAAEQIITVQNARGFPNVQDGYVVVLGAANDRWHAGDGKGRSNIVKVQLAARGESFSGHGYPVGTAQYQTEVTVGQKFVSVDINDDAWANVQLRAENSERRNRVQH